MIMQTKQKNIRVIAKNCESILYGILLCDKVIFIFFFVLNNDDVSIN